MQYLHTWKPDEKHYYPDNDKFTKVVGFPSPKEDNLSPQKERMAIEVKNPPPQVPSLDSYTNGKLFQISELWSPLILCSLDRFKDTR